MDEWEVFTPPHRGQKRATTPYLTISRRGDLLFNKAAMQLLALPSYVELAYSRAQQVIRLAPAKELVKRQSIPVRILRTVYCVAGTAFTKIYAIDTSEARRYPVVLRDGMLYIDLKQPYEQVSRKHRKQSDNN